MEETDSLKPVADLSRLSALIYVFGINKDIWRMAEQYFDFQPEKQSPIIQVGAILDRLSLRQNGWEVLAHRFGFEQRPTLEAVAEHLGVTRARVQQIEQRTFKKLHSGMSNVVETLQPLEDEVILSWRKVKQSGSAGEAIAVLQSLYTEAEHKNQADSIIRLLHCLRAAAYIQQSCAEGHLPHLTYIACALPPTITKHPRVGKEEDERTRQKWEADREWKYAELAEFVLQEEGKPLHYMTIAERAEELGKRSHFSTKVIHSVLYSGTDKFAYVDQGTYGLTAWGLVSVNAYTDIIADALKQSRRPLSFGDLLQHVSTERSIKPQTFQMTLDLHPRFYQSKQEQYGLRAWLPPREKQTLRTPDWLVETSASYERVTRAAERGYDIAAIVASDTPQK